MKREVYSFISGLLLFSCLAISCDDGKIYDENNQTEREGGTVKLTAQINGIDSCQAVTASYWPDSPLTMLSHKRQKGLARQPTGR